MARAGQARCCALGRRGDQGRRRRGLLHPGARAARRRADRRRRPRGRSAACTASRIQRALDEVHPGHGVLFGRSGWTGQHAVGHDLGRRSGVGLLVAARARGRDAVRRRAAASRTGRTTSAATSGTGWSSAARPSCCVRWLQFGCFTPLMHAHGRMPQEPWHYSERVLELYRAYVLLHEQLVPYVARRPPRRPARGLPIIRPLCLTDPGDPRGWTISDAYGYGPALWVAPVLDDEAREREVALPRGEWIETWSGARVRGGGRGRRRRAARADPGVGPGRLDRRHLSGLARRERGLGDVAGVDRPLVATLWGRAAAGSRGGAAGRRDADRVAAGAVVGVARARGRSPSARSAWLARSAWRLAGQGAPTRVRARAPACAPSAAASSIESPRPSPSVNAAANESPQPYASCGGPGSGAAAQRPSDSPHQRPPALALGRHEQPRVRRERARPTRARRVALAEHERVESTASVSSTSRRAGGSHDHDRRACGRARARPASPAVKYTALDVAQTLPVEVVGRRAARAARRCVTIVRSPPVSRRVTARRVGSSRQATCMRTPRSSSCASAARPAVVRPERAEEVDLGAELGQDRGGDAAPAAGARQAACRRGSPRPGAGIAAPGGSRPIRRGR